MTKEEFSKKWKNVDVDSLSFEQLKQFKEDCFQLYEETGFLEKFDSPYDDEGEHNGMRFEMLRRARPFNPDGKTEEEKGEVDLRAMPVWKIRFENGEEAFCYPEEICRLEHNGQALTWMH